MLLYRKVSQVHTKKVDKMHVVITFGKIEEGFSAFSASYAVYDPGFLRFRGILIKAKRSMPVLIRFRLHPFCSIYYILQFHRVAKRIFI